MKRYERCVSAAKLIGVQAAACCNGQEGFTVVELLVALAILGLGIALVSGAMSESLFRTTHAAKQAKAARFADLILAGLGAGTPIVQGSQTGQTDGIGWTLTIVPYGTAEDQAAWPVQPAEVTLSLGWVEAGQVTTSTWRTLRVFQRQPARP